MCCKKIYILMMSLLFAGVILLPAEAKRAVQSLPDTNTAGVSGLEYAKYKNQCPGRTCLRLIKKIISLEKNVDTLKQSKSRDYSELKIKEAEMYKFDQLFVDLATGKVAEQDAKALMDSVDSKRDSGCSDENKDQTDVPSTPQASLHQGDLVVWGIPSLPSIPRSRTKTSSKSSSSSANQAQAVNDASYQAVKGVEQESEKVTDQEINQFLNNLSSRAVANQ